MTFDIRDFGALNSPNDIGPSVQGALNAAIAYGGGGPFIPPREDGQSRAWGWTTFADGGALYKMSLSVTGTPGRSIINVAPGQPSLLRIGNSNGLCEIDGLTFLGDPGATGAHAPNIVNIQQARIGRMRRCQFWGLSCNATGFGQVRIVADTVDVGALLFVGCNYGGTLHGGGCLSISGERDACSVRGLRFSSSDGTFNGVTYNKSNAATNVHLWLGGQGVDGATTAYGEAEVASCWFDSNAAHHIDGNPESTFVLDRLRLRSCTFQGATNNKAPVYARHVNQLVAAGCMWGNSAAAQPAIDFDGQRLIVRESKGGTGGKTILTGNTPYVRVKTSCEGLALA